MICPTCGAESTTTFNFCRMCGHRFREMPAIPSNQSSDLCRAIRKLIAGIGLLIVAFIPLLEGEPMIWWLLFPGVPMVIKGLRLLAQAHIGYSVPNPHQAAPISSPTLPIVARISRDVQARPTGELVPPSVTENTTRLLEEDKGARRAGA